MLLHEICDKIWDCDICARRNFGIHIVRKASEQILLRLFQPGELIYMYNPWKSEENQTNQFWSNNFCKIRIGEEEALRTTFDRTSFWKFLLTLNLNYSALWEQKTFKLKYFVKPGLICINLQELRNLNITGCVCSKILLFVFEKRTFTQPHCTYLKMHLWNTRREPRPITSQGFNDVIKKAGPKSTLGWIRTTQVCFSQ